MTATITPCLWFDGQAEEAAAFYTSLFPNSRIDRVNRAPGDTPSGPEGSVLTVDFTIGGENFRTSRRSARPPTPFPHERRPVD